jgi:NAD+ synthase (glutamine-hydrolysing)
MKSLRIALIQINPLVGDLAGNTKKIIETLNELKSFGVELAVFPELSICGYPPEDLLLKPYFIKENKFYLNKIKSACNNITAIVGFPDSHGNEVYNAAAIIRNKKLIYVYHKMHLPNYGVFDEKRYFTPGNECAVFHEDGTSWAVNICEDIWVDPGPTMYEAKLGKANLVINISASPYHMGKLLQRENILKKQAKNHNAIIAYCNLIGGQDELVFDGGSLIVSPKGEIITRGIQFKEDIVIADLSLKQTIQKIKKYPYVKNIKLTSLKTVHKPILETRAIGPLPQIEEIYKALLLGTKDYVYKNGFKKVILGLSGGIDSALVCALAVDALGKENVIGVSMPSQFNSKSTQNDAQKLAKNLGIEFHTIPIKNVFAQYINILKPYFKNKPWDMTEENLQARIRGNILMAFSNKHGYLVLTTGNKSETSVGYCTLYGDMAGGFAVLKDVPKELVYKLSRYRNKIERKELIPETIFTRPPTAELRKNQKDEDSLPPYSILDPIIEAYVEKDKSLSQIKKQGVNTSTAKKVIGLIDKNEYKRRQAPPGVKITPKSFGKDRRMPITCHINNEK